MAKLATVRPLVSTLQGRVAKHSEVRDQVVEWRKWYHTTRWRNLRWSVLEAAMFTCARCGRLEGDTSQLVADHVIPHRGDEALFWSRANLQCLCAPCHNSAKQREERRGSLGM